MIILFVFLSNIAYGCSETLGEKCVRACLDDTFESGLPSHYDGCRKGCNKNPKVTMCLSRCVVKISRGTDPNFSPDTCKRDCEK